MDDTKQGPYRAVRGKLDRQDAREAYVTGPDITGRICPVASFWRYEEAVRYAKKMNAAHAANAEG